MNRHLRNNSAPASSLVSMGWQSVGLRAIVAEYVICLGSTHGILRGNEKRAVVVAPLLPPLRSPQQRPQKHPAKSKFLAICRGLGAWAEFLHHTGMAGGVSTDPLLLQTLMPLGAWQESRQPPVFTVVHSALRKSVADAGPCRRR